MNPMKMQKYPDMAVVKQKIFSSRIYDLHGDVSFALSGLPDTLIQKGDTVAVAVGSRGINRINEVVLFCLQYLKKRGAQPFIVPAMGSHGGATANGQKSVLAKLGITESSMQVSIVPDMDVECIGQLECDLEIYFSSLALEADHIILINRVKPHTKFKAEIESGLCKMMTIGLGKAEGATLFHRFAVDNGFGIIEDGARTILAQGRICFGLALLEDGHGELAGIEAVLPSDIIAREKKLLKDAYEMMGCIPFDDLDILIIDYIGKSISGIGMDSNITGRHRDITGDFFTTPHAKRIFVRDLLPGSDGNANGIGLADFTTNRLVKRIDMRKTYINALAAVSPEKASIPMHFETDRAVLDACAAGIGRESIENARIIRILNTSSLELMQISRAFEQEAAENQDIELVSSWEPILFDQNDNLKEI